MKERGAVGGCGEGGVGEGGACVFSRPHHALKASDPVQHVETEHRVAYNAEREETQGMFGRGEPHGGEGFTWLRVCEGCAAVAGGSGDGECIPRQNRRHILRNNRRTLRPQMQRKYLLIRGRGES